MNTSPLLLATEQRLQLLVADDQQAIQSLVTTVIERLGVVKPFSIVHLQELLRQIIGDSTALKQVRTGWYL